MQQQFQDFSNTRVWWLKTPEFPVVQNRQKKRVSGSGKPGLETLGTPPESDSSNYTINSIWLSEQKTAQKCTFGRKHQRYLAAMQYKMREDYLG